MSRELFGIELVKVEPEPGEVCSPDVIKFLLVHDIEGVLGVLYMDVLPRANKMGVAATHAVRFSKLVSCLPDHLQLPECTLLHSRELEGQYSLPRVCVVASLGTANSTQQYLEHAEVEILFHEYGHALAGLLSRTEYQHFGGTRVAIDYAEVPSTLIERFVWNDEFVQRFAFHHETGEPFPSEMLQTLREQSAAFAAMDEQRQALMALFDQHAHLTDQSDKQSGWTTELWWQLSNQHTALQPPSPELQQRIAPQVTFDHIVSYGASFYAYACSRSISAALWSHLFATQPLSRAVGDKIRKVMLEPAGATQPRKVIANLLDSDSTQLTPLLNAFVKALGEDVKNKKK